ncbi:MAG: HlyD family efflux transporter periplasmic adaptor subunit [Chthoniobacteraceae bacterium]
MAQEQTVEAARNRIQRLVDEIAALTKRDLRSEDFFQEYLNRVVQACDGKGGGVWLVGQRSAEGKNEFQLAAAVEFESSLFQSDELQRTNLLKVLAEVVKTRQPMVFAPDPQVQAALQAAPPEANRTPYPFIHVPLFLKEQVLGVLQVWMQPYVVPANYAEFATFLTSLATHVEQHLQSRRLGSLVVETQRLQHVLKFTSDLAGSLDPLEVARLSSNYGRDLIGCERCSVLLLEGDRWRVMSISGQDVVEKKSAMVKAMSAFVGAHAATEVVFLSKKELLARAEAPQSANGHGAPDDLSPAVRRTDEIDLAYFDLAHVVSGVIAPMLNAEKELVGAYFAESTTEGFFDGAAGSKEPASTTRLTEWLATHTGKSLQAAEDYHSLPFLAITKRMLATRRMLTGQKRRRSMLKIGIFSTILACVLLYPKMDRIDGDCVLTPMNRTAIVAEIPGRIERVLVREGDRVKAGDELAHLDKRKLETELETNAQERRRLNAEAERYRALGDEAAANVAFLQAAVADQNEKRINADIASATLRSRIDGVVVTKDLELHLGEYLQAGAIFAEVAALDAWEAQIDLNEKKIGLVEKELREGPVDVSFRLYSQGSHTFAAKLKDHAQISSQAMARDKENVFLITLKNIDVPRALQPALRPGLTGRGKIELGRRPLIVLWSTRIWQWFQMRMIG